jgi:hypothetical protein
MRITRGPALLVGGLAMAGALAGCGTATGPARPAQCTVLLAQLKTFDGTLIGESKTYNPLAEMGSSAAFQLQLRTDAGNRAVPQKLWTAETGLAAALQTFSDMGVNTALDQIKAVCG